jgi:hypothetical protein
MKPSEQSWPWLRASGHTTKPRNGWTAICMARRTRGPQRAEDEKARAGARGDGKPPRSPRPTGHDAGRAAGTTGRTPPEKRGGGEEGRRGFGDGLPERDLFSLVGQNFELRLANGRSGGAVLPSSDTYLRGVRETPFD